MLRFHGRLSRWRHPEVKVFVKVKVSVLRMQDYHDDVELNVLGCQVDILGTICDQCVSMVQCCFTSTETIRLVRTGSPDRHLDSHSQLLNSVEVWLPLFGIFKVRANVDA